MYFTLYRCYIIYSINIFLWVLETKDTKKLRKFRKKVKVPEDSKLIPQEVPYLLVGGGTAAFAAFRSIKSRDAKAKVHQWNNRCKNVFSFN